MNQERSFKEIVARCREKYEMGRVFEARQLKAIRAALGDAYQILISIGTNEETRAAFYKDMAAENMKSGTEIAAHERAHELTGRM